MSMVYAVGGASDIGFDREKQEDYFTFCDLGDYTTCAVIGDGTGSADQNPQPAAIAANHIIDEIKRAYDKSRAVFLKNPRYFLEMAFQNADEILKAFKLGSEEKYSGYFASMTAIIMDNWVREDMDTRAKYGSRDRSGKDGKGRRVVCNDLYYVHAGSTRLYLLRDGKLEQITRDDTKGMDMVDQGTIDPISYYTSPECLMLTNWLGTPELKMASGHIKLRPGDLVLLTTDGIHFAIRPEIMAQLILESQTPEDASAILVEAGKSLKYPDNMSAMVIGVQDA